MPERKTPQVRFKGFTDTWEQRKLSDFAQRESTIQISSPDYPSVEYEDIVAEEGRLNKDIRQKDMKKTGIFFDGTEVLYGKLRPYLHNWLNPDFAGVAVGDWWVLKPVEMDKNFLYRLIQTRNFDEIANQSTGSKMPRADWNLVSNAEFGIPSSLDEQRQIAEVFDSIDHLITLHQRECERLQMVKKSMLENCFPKNGEKVPRFRFAGFTGDWEQRKLEELVEKYEDPIETPHNGYTRLGIRSHARGTFHEYVEPGHELETAQMHRVAANKLIFNITFAWEHAVAITGENDAGRLVSHRFPQFTLSDSLRSEFLKYVILDEDFHHNLYLASPGGAGRNRVLKIDEALDYPIYYPSVDEQCKIGAFLDEMTELITLHQSKLEMLKKIKKSMLGKILV